MKRVAITVTVVLSLLACCSVVAAEKSSARTEQIAADRAFRTRIIEQMVNSGLASPQDLKLFEELEDKYPVYMQYSHNDEWPDTKKGVDALGVLVALEAFQPFINTSAKLEASLFNVDFPPALRRQWLAGVITVLGNTAEGVYTGKWTGISFNDSLPSVMNKWQSILWSDDGSNPRSDKIAIADRLLVHMLDYMEEEAPLARSARLFTESREVFHPWSRDIHWVKAISEINYESLGTVTGAILVTNRQNSVFLQRAEELLSSKRGLPTWRLEAVRLLSDYPDMSTDLLMVAAQHAKAMRNFQRNWLDGKNLYVFHWLPDQDETEALCEELLRQTRSRRLIVADAQKGPGIAVRTLTEAPQFTSAIAPLYILVSDNYGIPNEYKKAQNINALTGVMVVDSSGPRLLPVDLQTDMGAAILQWAVTKAVPAGEAIIIASRAEPLKLAARVAAWHITLLDDRLVLSKPSCGSFLRGLFPLLKKDAAALFMGQEEAIWFASPILGGTKWHMATPEKGLVALDDTPSTLVLTATFEQPVYAVFFEDYKMTTVNEWLRKHPRDKEGLDALAASNFYDKIIEELCNNEKELSYRYANKATMVLWRSYRTPKEAAVREIIFTLNGLHMAYRIEAAEKMLNK